MSELNPDHPVTQGLREQWFKLLAVVLWKYRDTLPKHVVLTEADFAGIAAAFPNMPTIVAHDRADGLHLRVMDESEGQRLADEVRATN